MRKIHKSLVIMFIVLIITIHITPVMAETSKHESNYGGTSISGLDELPTLPTKREDTLEHEEALEIRFSAESGDSIHYSVNVKDGGSVQCVLIPASEYSNYEDIYSSYERIEEGSRDETEDFTVHHTIEEGGDYIIIVTPVGWTSSSTVTVMAGQGFVSSIIISLGGYLQFGLLIAALILIPIVIQIYRKRNKEQQKKEYAQTSQAPLSQNQQSTQSDKNQYQSKPPPSYEEQNQQFKDQSQQQQPEQEQTQKQQSTQKPSSKQQTQMEKLEELKKLKEDGLITEEDFERKKKEILDNY